MAILKPILQQSRVNDMSNKQKCSECSCLPENVLVQTCNHCLCLWCVKDLIWIDNLKMKIVECPICKEETKVEEELYHQILEEIQKQPKSKLKRKNNNFYPQKEPSLLTKQEDYCIQKKCSEHKSYAIMYVCKTCEDVLVCPECLLSGNHIQHKSVSVEKQGVMIKQTLRSELNKISYRIQELQKVKDSHIRDIEMRKIEIEDIRHAARQKYQQIRKSINDQQNILLAKYSKLILAHNNQVEILKATVDMKVKNWQALRGNIIDILNPLLQETILGRSRGLEKMVIVTAIQSYSKIRESLEKPDNNHKNIHIVSEAIKAPVSSLHQDISLISKQKYSKDSNDITNNLPQNQYTIRSRPQTKALNANISSSKSIENNFFKLL